jgi:predicted nucleic acid-binding protein
LTLTSGKCAKSGMNVVERPRIYLDTNLFIDAFEGPDEVSTIVRPLLFELRNHPGLAVTSELTLAEVLVRPEREHHTYLKRIYLDLLIWSKAIDLKPVSRQILLESARYRAVAHPTKPGPEENRRNFLPDAIHVVTAIFENCQFFVARDTRIRLPHGMSRVSPDAAGVAQILSALT